MTDPDIPELKPILTAGNVYPRTLWMGTHDAKIHHALPFLIAAAEEQDALRARIDAYEASMCSLRARLAKAVGALDAVIEAYGPTHTKIRSALLIGTAWRRALDVLAEIGEAPDADE